MFKKPNKSTVQRRVLYFHSYLGQKWGFSYLGFDQQNDDHTTNCRLFKIDNKRHYFLHFRGKLVRTFLFGKFQHQNQSSHIELAILVVISGHYYYNTKVVRFNDLQVRDAVKHKTNELNEKLNADRPYAVTLIFLDFWN